MKKKNFPKIPEEVMENVEGFLIFYHSPEYLQWKEKVLKNTKKILEKEKTKSLKFFSKNFEKQKKELEKYKNPSDNLKRIGGIVKYIETYQNKNTFKEIFPFLNYTNQKPPFYNLIELEGDIKEIEYFGQNLPLKKGDKISALIFKAEMKGLEYLVDFEEIFSGKSGEVKIPLIYTPRKLKNREIALEIETKNHKFSPFEKNFNISDNYKKEKTIELETLRENIRIDYSKLYTKAIEKAKLKTKIPKKFGIKEQKNIALDYDEEYYPDLPQEGVIYDEFLI